MTKFKNIKSNLKLKSIYKRIRLTPYSIIIPSIFIFFDCLMKNIFSFRNMIGNVYILLTNFISIRICEDISDYYIFHYFDIS